MVLTSLRLATATSSGVRPCLFLAFRSAPCSTRNRTMGSEARPVMAACSAVSPLLVVALMSRPDSTQQLDRLDGVLLRALIVGRRRRAAVAPAHAGRKHQRVRLVRLRELRVGASREQHAHHGDVARLGCAHEGRGAFTERAIAGGVMTLEERRRQPRIRIGAMREQRLDQIDSIELTRWLRIGTPVADGQAVHVDGGVERRHPGFVVPDVRIGALLDQRRGDVVVRVDDRKDERGRAVGIGQVQIGAQRRQRHGGLERSCRAAYISWRPAAERQYRLTVAAARNIEQARNAR